MKPTPTMVQIIEIGHDGDGQRVDNYLIKKLKGVPKSHIYRIIRKGEVRVNKKRVKPETKLQLGDALRIPPVRVAQTNEIPRAGAGLLKYLGTSILFNGDDFMVVNKPQNLAVHRGSGQKIGLIDALRQLFPDESALELVHRLDKGTSGCIIISKNSIALRSLQRELKERNMHKTYHALVHGHWPDEMREVNVALQKSAIGSGQRIVKVASDGKSARTCFRVLKRYHGATLIEAKPYTGRTHQIRVHCQHVGHSILGDDKYTLTSNKEYKQIKNLCLHAHSISFHYGNRSQAYSFEAPENEAMKYAVRYLKGV